jgi:hypothetical protein
MPANPRRYLECTIAGLIWAFAAAAHSGAQEESPILKATETPTAVVLTDPELGGLPVLPAVPADVTGNAVAATVEDLQGTEALGTAPLVMEPCVTCVAAPFGYNLRSSNTSWLLGGGNQFGMFSLESLPTLKPGEQTGLVAGIGIHWLSGPVQTDLPPRLFDFQIGLQRRKWLTDSLGYDIVARIGAFSDFEGSAREGIRFPSHGVGFVRLSPTVDFVLGVDYLSRDDVKLLPVAGLILKPRDDLRLDLVFPRPCIEWQFSPDSSLYLAGELGGGTWAIERTPDANDVVTYRDYRLLLGVSSRKDDGHQSALEFGYVFGRHLSYRSGQGDYSPIDTLVIQLTQRY